ncbi:MAG: hypothetical protein CMD25_01145 [Flavobacteriales bacterium]|nr:hypothetical protein [Flavobacteriales bacterium]
MSQLNSLLESANPYKSLQSDAARLAAKWNKTGLLEGIGNETEKNNMSMILENQAKQLVMEETNTGGGAGAGSFTPGTGPAGQWAGVALPLVRKVFGQIAAKEFVSVQPMNLPSGLVFYLDFQYGTTKEPFTAGNSLYGNEGTDPSTAPFGNTNEGGLYGAGRFGYSINNTQSTAYTVVSKSVDWYIDLQADSDVSQSYVAGATGQIVALDVPVTATPDYDTRAVKGFRLSGSAADLPTDGTAVQYPEFTRVTQSAGADVIRFFVGAGVNEGGTLKVVYTLQTNDAERGDFEEGNTNLNGNNNPITIPEINIQMQSEAIVAKTRKLKAVWTPEFAQDLNAYHSLDAEAELTSIMSEYISLEIDLEILDMLIESAAAGDEYWSAQNNLALASTGVVDADLGFYNSQGQWFQTLGTKIQKLSNIIHQKTLRGGANFLVCSPTVATIIESIPGFASTSDGDAAKASYAFGVQKAGTINSRYTVYKNPYMTENVILLGFRGGQFLEAGAVFAPYIPLIMTPLVYDPDTFTPRKGLLTRYAKKVVRPEFYGKIFVNGLNTL